MDRGLVLPAMAPRAARRLFCLSRVAMVPVGAESRGELRPAAKAWFAAELPHMLGGVAEEDCLSPRAAFSAARTAAVLEPAGLGCGCQAEGIL